MTAETLQAPWQARRGFSGPPPSLGEAVHFRQRAAQAGVDLDSPVVSGDLTVDLDAYEVRDGGEVVELSPRQVELLSLFVAASGRVWSRDLLHWVCWAEPTPSRRVDVQLCRIRTRLGRDVFRNIRDRGWTRRSDRLGPAAV
jgi:DNA-binding response OmpR family regulator